jgi:glyoxylase-like metal-dependent hydrolase (beta-lactamase superfamily II)
MQVKRIDPHVFYVQGVSEMGSSANQNFISNAGFVVTPAGVVVVDALGSPELARRLLAEIRKITKKPIHTVVLTHYHADHIYGLQVSKRLVRVSWRIALQGNIYSPIPLGCLSRGLSPGVVAVD